MRIAFAGTPDFARQALQALLDAGHVVSLVLTQPDRASGRGLKRTPSPVKQLALAHGLPVQQPRSLRLDGRYPDDASQAREALLAAAPAVLVVAAYGLILPPWVLELPPWGCLNIHASLLPRWRGAAPIQRAIEAGDTRSGITIMQMDAGLDTGDMLYRIERPLLGHETGASLHDALAQDGAAAIVHVLAQLEAGEPLSRTPQPAEGATYADKLLKSEAALDFNQPAAVLARRIRAFDPFPGCTIEAPGVGVVKVWAAEALPQPPKEGLVPGRVMPGPHLDVATADGILRIGVVQKPGGRRQPAEVFLRDVSMPSCLSLR
ncbi:methionyl-tRNA formyltransferase [Castellaniella sp.]|uniref:methionyl-tRNA formyltransferase n=1 Tax=Castellaniella sp. TaxID=1955812 RepID=UPI003564CFDC